MKKLATRLTICVLALLALVNYSSTIATAPAQPATELPVRPEQTALRWPLPANAAQAQLLLAQPDGSVTRQTFAAGATPTLGATDASGKRRPDGAYVYELRVQLKADPASLTARQTPDENG